MVIDPHDPDTIYSQWQYGGLVRFNRATGERVDIKPQTERGGDPLRWNWDSALMISPYASERLYYGSQILFCSDDRGDTRVPVSEDLSRDIDRNTLYQGDTSAEDQVAIVDYIREATLFFRAVQGASNVVEESEEQLDEIQQVIDERHRWIATCWSEFTSCRTS